MERVITIKRRHLAEGDQGETYKLYMSPRMEILRIPFEASDDSFFEVVNDWVAMTKRHGDTVVLLLEAGVPLQLIMRATWRGEPTIKKLLWLKQDGTREHILGELEGLIVRVIEEKGGRATAGELISDSRIVGQLGHGVRVVDILLLLSNSGVVKRDRNGYFTLLEP